MGPAPPATEVEVKPVPVKSIVRFGPAVLGFTVNATARNRGAVEGAWAPVTSLAVSTAEPKPAKAATAIAARMGNTFDLVVKLNL